MFGRLRTREIEIVRLHEPIEKFARRQVADHFEIYPLGLYLFLRKGSITIIGIACENEFEIGHSFLPIFCGSVC